MSIALLLANTELEKKNDCILVRKGWVRVMKTILQILLTLSNPIQGSNLTSVLRSGGTKRI